MPITYRLWVHDGDWRRDSGRHSLRPLGWTVTVKRISKRATTEVLERARQSLARITPHPTPFRGRPAQAVLEQINSRGSREVLLRATGKTTVWRIGRDGHSKVPDGGVWTLEDGSTIGTI